MNNPSFIAGADIPTSIFVKPQGTTHNAAIIPAGAGDKPSGISAEGSDYPPIPGAGTPLAAHSGYSCRVYGLGEVCEVFVGSAAVNSGDYLKSDASGYAVTATVGDYYGAKALDYSAASGRVKCQVLFGKL